MNYTKTGIVFGSIALLLAASAAAFMAGGYGRGAAGRGITNMGMSGSGMAGGMAGMMAAGHEQMESIMEGTYQDFLAFRESAGYPLMPWISSEADFQLMQERHEQMEEWMEQRGGCPMHQ